MALAFAGGLVFMPAHCFYTLFPRAGRCAVRAVGVVQPAAAGVGAELPSVPKTLGILIVREGLVKFTLTLTAMNGCACCFLWIMH